MLHLQHRNQQFLGKWPSTAMWLDTNLAFRRLDTTMVDQWPPLSLFLNFEEFAFANFDCKIRIYLIAMLTICVLLSTLITKTHRFIIVKNIKNPPNLRILQCCDHAHSSEYSGSVTVWGFILFRYYYRFYIAANPSSLGVFLHICIICRYFYK